MDQYQRRSAFPERWGALDEGGVLLHGRWRLRLSAQGLGRLSSEKMPIHVRDSSHGGGVSSKLKGYIKEDISLCLPCYPLLPSPNVSVGILIPSRPPCLCLCRAAATAHAAPSHIAYFKNFLGWQARRQGSVRDRDMVTSAEERTLGLRRVPHKGIHLT